MKQHACQNIENEDIRNGRPDEGRPFAASTGQIPRQNETKSIGQLLAARVQRPLNTENGCGARPGSVQDARMSGRDGRPSSAFCRGECLPSHEFRSSACLRVGEELLWYPAVVSSGT